MSSGPSLRLLKTVLHALASLGPPTFAKFSHMGKWGKMEESGDWELYRKALYLVSLPSLKLFSDSPLPAT